MIAFGGCCLSIIEFSVLNYFVIYLKEQVLLAAVTAGFMLGVLDAGGLCGKFVCGFISDRLFRGKRKGVFLILIAIATIASAVIAFLRPGVPMWLIFACAAVFGFSAFGWVGIFFIMLGEQTGQKHVALVSGVVMAIHSLAIAGGTPLMGYLADRTHAWTWSWVYILSLGVISALLISFVREERRKM